MTARRSGVIAGVGLLIVYLLTLAPGLTFWDAGEFIAAAHVFGIPHPPGTPLYVALGRSLTLLLGGALGVARTMNLLSASATAVAGGLGAWVVADATRRATGGMIGGIAGALCAGLMVSVWANATETEVYAIALLHVTVMIAAAYRASISDEKTRPSWVLLTVYLIVLAPAVHLSALVGAPAAIVLAARNEEGAWNRRRLPLLAGATLLAAGVGRMSFPLATLGVLLVLAAAMGGRESRDAMNALEAIALGAIASSALLIMLVRARAGPALNQGDPSTWTALADVIARRQYDLAPLWPRRAPVWLQVANVAQYTDWQVAMGWGAGIFTRPARIVAMLAFFLLGGAGYRAMRRDARALCTALITLLVCGTIGVMAYLNMKAGVSIGYGMVPADAHEARERDYFFVLGFWAWGLLAGYGAMAYVRRRNWPLYLALIAPLLPLVGNWKVVDRRTGIEATAARTLAAALLESAPRNGVLFLAGDNDTYPIWYLQLVEGVRQDVIPVTIPLLAAEWYEREVAARSGLRWRADEPVSGADYLHIQRAALIARAAIRAGRPVAVTTQVPAAQRKLLGSAWRLDGVLYVAGGPPNGGDVAPTVVAIAAPQQAATAPYRARSERLPDDVAAVMLGSLECRRLGEPIMRSGPARDSLETRCNFR
jgi:hypothetical protein